MCTIITAMTVSPTTTTPPEPVAPKAELTDITGQVADSSLRHVIITGSVSQDFHTVDKYTEIHDIAQTLYDLRTTAIFTVSASALWCSWCSSVWCSTAPAGAPAPTRFRLRLLDRIPWDVTLILGAALGALGLSSGIFFIQAFAAYFIPL